MKEAEKVWIRYEAYLRSIDFTLENIRKGQKEEKEKAIEPLPSFENSLTTDGNKMKTIYIV